jgi:hypothetical protein
METKIKGGLVMTAFYQAVAVNTRKIIVHTKSWFTVYVTALSALTFAIRLQTEMESFYRTLKESLFRMLIMIILNKPAWICLNTLRTTTTLQFGIQNS